MFLWYAMKMLYFRNLVSTFMRLYSFLSLANTTACTLGLSRKDACIMHTVINDVYYFGLSLNTMLPGFISDVSELPRILHQKCGSC